MTFVDKYIGWLSLGAVALVFAFVLGMLAGRNAEGTIPVPAEADIGPVVKHGVAAVMICGNWPASKGLGLSKAGTGNGMWVPAPRQNDCQVWYHRPPHPDEEWYREGTGGSPTSGPA